MGNKRKAKTKNKRVKILLKQRLQREQKKGKSKHLKGKFNLVILLGAGFSMPMGYPSGWDIAQKFDRDLREQFLEFSSEEWAFRDGRSQADIENGQGYNALGYSYVFNEIVRAYKQDRDIQQISNYEDFYQYAIDLSKKNEAISAIYAQARVNLLTDFGDEISAEYLFMFENPQYKLIQNILDYLISDLLFRALSDSEIKAKYHSFISVLKKYRNIDITSLNHDLLLEEILSIGAIPCTRGFSTRNSCIAFDNKSLPVFTNTFNKKCKLFKLHGSIDTYSFGHLKNISGMLYPTGKTSHFLTNDFDEKHHAKRINPNTKEVVQEFNANILPMYITGQGKDKIIKQSSLYNPLYNQIQRSFRKCQKLLVIGYSYGDAHVNELLRNSKFNLVVNVNLRDKYLFKGCVRNVDSINCGMKFL
jgi:hypothetical protein